VLKESYLIEGRYWGHPITDSTAVCAPTHDPLDFPFFSNEISDVEKFRDWSPCKCFPHYGAGAAALHGY